MSLKRLEQIEKDFYISGKEIQGIIKDFYSEMCLGLRGKKSSLKMIPTYVDRPSGGEKGKFIALDLGGTNFRVVELELQGRGRFAPVKEKQFVIDKKYTVGEAKKFFDFLALCVKKFCKEEKIWPWEERKIGFTFSFPVKQTAIARGSLIHWTKDFAVRGVEGKDVVRLLREALTRKGLHNMRIVALVNDTVGTLASEAYEDEDCDIAIILGTGTNACYEESAKEILKWQGSEIAMDNVIINIEWGNFNKLRLTAYDRLLDRSSDNPGYQILEKMVSGMYLGEITRLILKDLASKKFIFNGSLPNIISKPKGFKAEYMSRIEVDRSGSLLGVNKFLKGKGIYKASSSDRKIIKTVCQIVSRRGARLAAAALAAVVIKVDKGLKKQHTIAVDGSVYEKHPNFAKNMHLALKQIFGSKVSKIKMIMAKDGSGRGAAIIASLTASVDDYNF